MNIFCGVGRITNELKLRELNGGKCVLNFQIAISAFKKDAPATFISCIVWNESAKNLAKYGKKGSLLEITGSIITSDYEKNGTKIYKTDINVREYRILSSVKQENVKQDDPFTTEELGDIINDELKADSDMPF